MTTEYVLNDSWALVSSAAAMVQMVEGLNIWLFAGEEAPVSEAPHALLTIRDPRYPYPGSANLYARRAPNSEGVRTRMSVTLTGDTRSMDIEPDEYMDFPANTDGAGFVQLADNEAWMQVSWGKEGSLILINSSLNVSTEDGPDRLFVSYSDDSVRIVNRFSETKTATCGLNYR